MSQVLVLKLASGEEIIGRTTDSRYSVADEIGVNNTITLEKVRVIAPMQTPDGRINVSLMPYVFSNIDVEVQININHIVGVPTKASETMERSYLEQTSSIALAS